VNARRLSLSLAIAALVGGLGIAVSVAAKQATAPTAAPANPDAGAPMELSSKVKIVFQTIPPEKATVMWGKKSIGLIRGKNKPLIIERPRDSGPMDVVVRAQGYVPVHSRAYTFTDSKLYVKITPVAEKKTIFGYREELPDAGPPEAGLPQAAVPHPDAGIPPLP
jgi:hypothetical protein